MKWVFGAALVLSLCGNVFLGFRLMKAGDVIEAGAHAELLSTMALEDLAYFLRQGGIKQAQLVELARQQPAKAHQERSPPELEGNRLLWFPLEMTFTNSGTIDQIKVAGDTY